MQSHPSNQSRFSPSPRRHALRSKLFFQRALMLAVAAGLVADAAQSATITINDPVGTPSVTTDLGSHLAATSLDMVTFFSFANRGITLPAGTHSVLFTSPSSMGGQPQIVDFATLYIVKNPVGQAFDITLLFESMGAVGFSAQAAALLQSGAPEIASAATLNLSSLLGAGALNVSFNGAGVPDAGSTALLLGSALLGLVWFGRKQTLAVHQN